MCDKNNIGWVIRWACRRGILFNVCIFCTFLGSFIHSIYLPSCLWAILRRMCIFFSFLLFTAVVVAHITIILSPIIIGHSILSIELTMQCDAMCHMIAIYVTKWSKHDFNAQPRFQDCYHIINMLSNLHDADNYKW